MADYIRRFLIVFIMGLCISLLFLGGKTHAAMQNTDHWIWPSDGIVSDLFGTRDGNHRGIDIAGELNDPIYSVDDGIVEKSYYSDTYGNVIFIKHSNDLVTVYAHMAERLATEGEKVKQGDLIGGMGSTGISTGVHLHFEVHQTEWTFEKENAVDPMHVIGHGHVAMGEIVSSKLNAPNKTVEVMNYVPTMDLINDDVVLLETNLYTVEDKDTLWEIAEQNEVTVDQLKKDNNLRDDIIYPNQQLKIRKQKEYHQYKGFSTISIER